MPRNDDHGTDAIADGIDRNPGWDSSRGPRPDFQQSIDNLATTRPQAGSFAEALEQDEGRKVHVTRHGDEPAEETHPTDVYGNRLAGKMLLAEALEQRAHGEEGR